MALVEPERSRTPATIRASDWAKDTPDNVRSWGSVLWIGYGILFLFFGVFGLWAGFAPLGSGAIAQGKVTVSGSQRTLQHLEGGIIQKILVKEGQEVKAGDVLMILDDTRTRSQFSRVEQQFLVALARDARLKAERNQKSVIDFPNELMDHAGSPEVADIIDGKRRLFQNRQASIRSQIGLLERRVAKSEEEITAMAAQQHSDRRQLELIAEEIGGVRELVNKGLERKPRLLRLQRDQAALNGSINNRTALIARAEQTIAETRFQLQGLLEQSATEVETSLADTQLELEDLREQMNTTKDALARSDIRAPISGKVYGLRFHTIGGVIGPAEPILNIVPDDEELVVTVHLDPNYRDVIHKGATTSVRFTSFSQRTTKPIDGILVQISADAVQPEQGAPFYEGQIELNPDMLKLHGLELEPGMPAQAIISTGDQTLLDYLVSPLLRSLETALREQ